MAPPVALQFSQLRLHHRPILASSAFPPKGPKRRTLLARDMRIELGKYKGCMLGTLPSSYLKWLAESEVVQFSPSFSLSVYSELAKMVLKDPVYQDRIEWEPAWRLLFGETKGSFTYDKNFDLMKAYREIGESFGWDMDDEEGWKKVKRDYIGTSFSGRIPRKNGEKRDKKKKIESVSVGSVKKVEVFVGAKRAERIQRMKLKREMNQKILKSTEEKQELVLSDDDSQEEEKVGFLDKKKRERRERMRVKREKLLEEEIHDEMEEGLPTIKKGRGSRRKKDFSERNMEIGEFKIKTKMTGFAKRNGVKGNGEIFNPFPGRDSLFDKAKKKES